MSEARSGQLRAEAPNEEAKCQAEFEGRTTPLLSSEKPVFFVVPRKRPRCDGDTLSPPRVNIEAHVVVLASGGIPRTVFKIVASLVSQTWLGLWREMLGVYMLYKK